MRYGAITAAVLLAAAGGGCVNLHAPPSYVRYTYDPPTGYADDEELPLGSYDGKGVKVEVGRDQSFP